MTLETYTSPLCETVKAATFGVLAASGFDDNNNTENPGREDWDNLG